MASPPGVLQTGLPPGPGFLLGGRCRIELDRPRLMGILNVTPDSFSGDGLAGDTRRAIEHARSQFEAGADLLDLGAESSRPGAGSAQALMTARKAVSQRTSKMPWRTVRRRRRGTWKLSSGMMPRHSGSTQ